MSGIEDDQLDILVVHVDCSMAHNEGADRVCPPPDATAEALRTVILSNWLGIDECPDFLVLMTPSKTTDTWLFVGQGFDVPDTLRPIECSFEVENEFVRRKLLRRRGGEVKKPSARIEPMAEATATNWDQVRSECHEAFQFWEDLVAAAEAR